MAKDKLALALGGGGARGWAHIGILRALSKAGLRPDIVVGTSIGAIVGGHYAAGRLDQLEDFAQSLTRRRVFSFLDLSVSGSGLITGQRLFDRFDDHLKGLTIEELPMRFAAIATDLANGHEIWLRRGIVTDAVRASSAIPGIVRPVSLNGRWLVDGCLSIPFPSRSVGRLGRAPSLPSISPANSAGAGSSLMTRLRRMKFCRLSKKCRRLRAGTASGALRAAAPPAVWPSPRGGAGHHVGDLKLVQYFPRSHCAGSAYGRSAGPFSRA